MIDIFSDGVVLIATPVGSRRTVSPPPTNTDDDTLVLVHTDFVQQAIEDLLSKGFKLDNPDSHYKPEDGLFKSWRKGNLNLIVTSDVGFHARFLTATHVAKKLNLKDKPERIMLFQAILYGNKV